MRKVTYTVQPVLSGQPREVAKVAAKARWLFKSGALGEDDSLGLTAMVFEIAPVFI